MWGIKLSVVIALATAACAAPAASNSTNPNNPAAITAAVVPDFGVTPGIPSKTQPGSCIGDQNKDIPCYCPPTKAAFANTLSIFMSRTKAGNDSVQFSTNFTDQSAPTNLLRANAMIATLQNLNFDKSGKTGDGCPVVSAPTLLDLRKQVLAGQSVRIGA